MEAHPGCFLPLAHPNQRKQGLTSFYCQWKTHNQSAGIYWVLSPVQHKLLSYSYKLHRSYKHSRKVSPELNNKTHMLKSV